MNDFEKNVELLKLGLESFKIDVDEKMLVDFEEYRLLLEEYNKVMNLTGITEQRDAYIKHFLDSVAIFKNGYIEDGISVIDVGTGAGFPGIPFKIANKNISLTLLDSLNKRINFLKEVGKKLNLEDVEYIHSRAEEASKKDEYREKYDIATARAVASLPILLEYCTPYVKVGGFFICLKGPSVKEEIVDSRKAMDILGVRLVEKIDVELPDEDLHHNILVFKKERNTPKQYPRRSNQISKKPL